MNYSHATDAAAVRAELRRIVAAPDFEDSDRLVRFLTFVVEQTLAGNGGQFKESVIGTEVFGRAPGYDPKTDPIVRVQARRLRAKLDHWYQNGGQASTLRIALPKGGYAPEFAPPPLPAPQPVREPAPASMGLLLLAAGAVLLTNSRTTIAYPGSRPFTAYPGYQTSPAFSPDGLTPPSPGAAVPKAAAPKSMCSRSMPIPRAGSPPPPNASATPSGCPTAATSPSFAMTAPIVSRSWPLPPSTPESAA